MSAGGCDKRATVPAAEARPTSLAGKPRVVYLMFGDRADPRLLPIATLADGTIAPISLSPDGWRGFDNLYFRAGAHIAAYQDGRSIGGATVRRGMWDGSAPLYKLPHCRALRPLAAASLDAPDAPTGPVILELLATSDPLAVPPLHRPVSDAEGDSARALADRVGQREGLSPHARGELELVSTAIRTGATDHPTLVASYSERGLGALRRPRHVFLIGDYDATTRGYVQSFVHVADDSTRDFRRYIDHADLTGSGTDVVVLEGWRNSGDSYLVFLRFGHGHWREVARGATSWCADEPAS